MPKIYYGLEPLVFYLTGEIINMGFCSQINPT